jgi:hypothetical protein
MAARIPTARPRKEMGNYRRICTRMPEPLDSLSLRLIPAPWQVNSNGLHALDLRRSGITSAQRVQGGALLNRNSSLCVTADPTDVFSHLDGPMTRTTGGVLASPSRSRRLRVAFGFPRHTMHRWTPWPLRYVCVERRSLPCREKSLPTVRELRILFGPKAVRFGLTYCYACSRTS